MVDEVDDDTNGRSNSVKHERYM